MVALFGKKEEKNESVNATQANSSHSGVASRLTPSEDIAAVLRQPRITEKATYGTADNVYVFTVAPNATKKQIKEAVVSAYKVTPVKVNVVVMKKKVTRNPRTGKVGAKGGGKKAYVYLKKGETISIM